MLFRVQQVILVKGEGRMEILKTHEITLRKGLGTGFRSHVEFCDNFPGFLLFCYLEDLMITT